MPKTPVKTSTSPVTVPSTVPSSSPSSVAATGEQEIKLDKIKITPYSDSKDWESTVFELQLVLQKVWLNPSLDIIRYLTETKYALSEMGSSAQVKADKLIYYILSSGSVRDSFARNTIIAAQSSTAQPHIPDNEGLQLFNHFDQLFVSKD